MRLKRDDVRRDMFEPDKQIAPLGPRGVSDILACLTAPQAGTRLGMQDKILETQVLRQMYRRMIKSLITQPVVIADHTVPRVAHHRKDEEIGEHLWRDQPVKIGKRGMFPQPPACLHILQTAPPLNGLGRVAQHHVILHRPRFKRQRHRRAAGLGGVDEQIFAAGGQDHEPCLSDRAHAHKILCLRRGYLGPKESPIISSGQR